MNRTKRFLVDRSSLPELFPTNVHPPLFWEELGRTVATFGFLEEILGKAIFAFTATRVYSPSEIEAEYAKWLPTLEKALTDALYSLADSCGKAAREHQDSSCVNVNEIVENLKKAANIRNALCHGSWGTPDIDGKSLPFFLNRKMEMFQTKVDILFFRQVQDHVRELTCDVVDMVAQMGLQFPGSIGPEKKSHNCRRLEP